MVFRQGMKAATAEKAAVFVHAANKSAATDVINSVQDSGSGRRKHDT
jgi:hypothetical protein